MTKPCLRTFSSSKHPFLNAELWCFSFVTLFNLQGTRPLRSAAEHLLFYHTLANLSSTFFNFFRNFLSCTQFALASCSNSSVIIPDSLALVKPFFRLLSKSFPAPQPPYSRTAEQLGYYNKLAPICQAFSFASTNLFFAAPLCTPVPPDSLASIAGISSFVNT